MDCPRKARGQSETSPAAQQQRRHCRIVLQDAAELRMRGACASENSATAMATGVGIGPMPSRARRRRLRGGEDGGARRARPRIRQFMIGKARFVGHPTIQPLSEGALPSPRDRRFL